MGCVFVNAVKSNQPVRIGLSWKVMNPNPIVTTTKMILMVRKDIDRSNKIGSRRGLFSMMGFGSAKGALS